MAGPRCTHDELVPGWSASALTPVILQIQRKVLASSTQLALPPFLWQAAGKSFQEDSVSRRKHQWDGQAAKPAFTQPHAMTPASCGVGQGSGPGPAHVPRRRRGVSLRVTPSICPEQVVGVKDSQMGEEVCACIRVRAGQKCTEEEVKAFCKGKVGLSALSSLAVHPAADGDVQMNALRFRANWASSPGLGSTSWAGSTIPSRLHSSWFSFPRSPISRSHVTSCLWISTRSPARAR